MSPFYYFQSYPNTYCTKFKGTPAPFPQTTLVTPKNGHLSMPRPQTFYICHCKT